MSIETIIDSLPPELRNRLERDSVRAKTMASGGHLQDWLDFEVSLHGVRNEAMRISHSNTPTGGGYNKALAQLMEHYGLDKLNGESVSAVLWLTDPTQKYGDDHRTRKEILDAILNKLKPGERSRLASPITARQRVKKVIDLLVADPLPKKERSVSKLKQTEQELAVALEEVAKLKKQLERDDGGSTFDWKQTTAKEVATLIAAYWGERKWRDVKAAANALYAKKQKPAG